MKHLIAGLGLAIVGLMTLITIASAQTTSTGGAIFDVARPFLVEIASILVAALVGWIATMVRTKFNIDIEAKHREALQSTLTNAAGLIINRAGGVAGAINLTTGSPVLNEGVNYVVKNAPDALSYFGLTPDRLAAELAQKLEAKIGVMASTGAAAQA